MLSLRQISRSRFVVALLLFTAVSQQLSAFAHTGMLARAALGGSMLEEVCTSVGLTRVSGETAPGSSSGNSGAACDLCTAATASLLTPALSNVLPTLAVVDDEPEFASPLPVASPHLRAYQSRAPPRFLLA